MPLSYLLSMALSQCFIFLKNGHKIAVLGGLALHAVTVFAIILVLLVVAFCFAPLPCRISVSCSTVYRYLAPVASEGVLPQSFVKISGPISFCRKVRRCWLCLILDSGTGFFYSYRASLPPPPLPCLHPGQVPETITRRRGRRGRRLRSGLTGREKQLRELRPLTGMQSLAPTPGSATEPR